MKTHFTFISAWFVLAGCIASMHSHAQLQKNAPNSIQFPTLTAVDIDKAMVGLIKNIQSPSEKKALQDFFNTASTQTKRQFLAGKILLPAQQPGYPMAPNASEPKAVSPFPRDISVIELGNRIQTPIGASNCKPKKCYRSRCYNIPKIPGTDVGDVNVCFNGIEDCIDLANCS